MTGDVKMSKSCPQCGLNTLRYERSCERSSSESLLILRRRLVCDNCQARIDRVPNVVNSILQIVVGLASVALFVVEIIIRNSFTTVVIFGCASLFGLLLFFRGTKELVDRRRC